jgi:hypothetical protein
MVGIFLGCLTFSTAHAQDMSIWIGKWFKLTVKSSGYSINESEAISSYKETEVNYLKILNVDETNKVINFLNYFYHDDEWQGESVDFHYFGGSSLDFLCYYFECEGGEEDRYCFGFTGRIQGKMKKGILTSATIKSLGGFEWNVPRGAAGVTVTGSLIPESKLPPDIPTNN